MNEDSAQNMPETSKESNSSEASAPAEKEEIAEKDKTEENGTDDGFFYTSDLHPNDENEQTIYAVTTTGCCFPVEKLMSELNLEPSASNENQEDTTVNRNRRARFNDNDRNESKTKKLKSCRPSEYRFNAAELPEKTLKLFDEAPPTFTFTARNNEKCRSSCSYCGFKTEEKREKNGNSGKKNYNRFNNHNAAHGHNFGQPSSSGPQGQWRGNDKIPTVDMLPSPLLNGVLNVASSAFSTARTVLNNIQSTMTPIVVRF